VRRSLDGAILDLSMPRKTTGMHESRAALLATGT
jgi:hypothetical protein